MEGGVRRRRAEDRRLSGGFIPPGSPDIPALRQRIRSAPARPYDNIESAPFATGEALTQRIGDLIAGGFSKLGFQTSITAPDFTTGTRSFHFLLHAWDPLSTLLNGLLPLTRPEGLDACLAYARAWLDRFQGAAERAGVQPLVEAARSGSNEAWEGMAAGMRAFRLAALLEAAARDEGVDDATVGEFAAALSFHFRVLREPGYFQSWSNHGLYQSLGLISAAARFPWLDGAEGLVEIARERLDTLLANHFDADGVHLEHSPTYHSNLLGSLIGARNAGLLEGTRSAEAIAGAERALSWMITPAGRVVAFGDSWPAEVRTALPAAGRFRDPALRYLTSDGAIGDPPAPGAVLYRNAGYAFARMHDPDWGEDPSQASYLAQAGAFHSRVHKHADHLTFSWSEGTTDILIQPGRYGYLGRTAPGSELHDRGHWYDDPHRIYVESTRAHNCVEVDGQDHPRRGAAPFGGGVLQAEAFRDIVLFQSAAPLTEDVRQHRVLILKPHRFLLVVDRLEASLAHRYRQWFQLDGAWTASQVGHGYRAACGPRALEITDLTIQAVAEPVRRGEKEPQLQGWVSPRDGALAECSSLAFTREGETVEFVTLFSLSDGPVADAVVGRAGEASRHFAWSQGGLRTELDLSGTGRLRAVVRQSPL
ncbi:MAG: heparinase II/III family protein [Caulobacteraceae bacterium]|nr:heparinase II/III family protein [Caulobacteraceae bacterium]